MRSGRFTHRVDRYAEAVLDGGIVAGPYVRLACERHFRDRERAAGGGWFQFSEAFADQILDLAIGAAVGGIFGGAATLGLGLALVVGAGTLLENAQHAVAADLEPVTVRRAELTDVHDSGSAVVAGGARQHRRPGASLVLALVAAYVDVGSLAETARLERMNLERRRVRHEIEYRYSTRIINLI